MDRFQTPTVMFKSYSGDRLNIVAQLPVTLTQGDYKVSSVVLIQKNAPNGLLIGTDLQPALGFRLTVEIRKLSSWEMMVILCLTQ